MLTEKRRIQPLGLPHNTVDKLHVVQSLCCHDSSAVAENCLDLCSQVLNYLGANGKVVESLMCIVVSKFPLLVQIPKAINLHVSDRQRRRVNSCQQEKQGHIS